jgi:hypothetical protein
MEDTSETSALDQLKQWLSSAPQKQKDAGVVAIIGTYSGEGDDRKPGWDVLWKTGEEWRTAANAQASKTIQTLPAMRERLHVTVQPSTMDGVGCMSSRPT